MFTCSDDQNAGEIFQHQGHNLSSGHPGDPWNSAGGSCGEGLGSSPGGQPPRLAPFGPGSSEGQDFSKSGSDSFTCFPKHLPIFPHLCKCHLPDSSCSQLKLRPVPCDLIWRTWACCNSTMTLPGEKNVTGSS
jgi:hypothetical protein